jgi:hypothetical protein
VIAGLVATVGRLVAEGLLGVDLLPPTDRGVLGWSETFSYAAGAVVLALVCTAVGHLLVLTVPRPVVFFEWIVTLIGLALVAASFVVEGTLESQLATAVVTAIVAAAVGTLLGGLLVVLRRQGAALAPSARAR